MKDCIDHAVLPMDGATLAEVMRQRGINMRYLGKVLDLVLRSPAREQLDHIYVSGARGGGLCGPGAEWRPGAGPRLPSLNPCRKLASESSSPALPSTSSRHTYRYGGAGQGEAGEEPWAGA